MRLAVMMATCLGLALAADDGVAAPATGGATTLAAGPRGELRVIIRGVESDKGHVLVALHHSAKTWYTDSNFAAAKFRAYAEREIPAHTGAVSATFHHLPAGRYAVTAFHDEDDDRHLDRWIYPFTGMPMEHYGLSNGAWSPLGKASFDAASFAVAPSGTTTITVQLGSHVHKALRQR